MKALSSYYSYYKILIHPLSRFFAPFRNTFILHLLFGVPRVCFFTDAYFEFNFDIMTYQFALDDVTIHIKRQKYAVSMKRKVEKEKKRFCFIISINFFLSNI